MEGSQGTRVACWVPEQEAEERTGKMCEVESQEGGGGISCRAQPLFLHTRTMLFWAEPESAVLDGWESRVRRWSSHVGPLGLRHWSQSQSSHHEKIIPHTRYKQESGRWLRGQYSVWCRDPCRWSTEQRPFLLVKKADGSRGRRQGHGLGVLRGE